jgi:AcrR family transcriptional regulator
MRRALLHRFFKRKGDIFEAVFADRLTSRHPAAPEAAESPGDPRERLITVCRVMALEPWSDMSGTLMGSEFAEASVRPDPEADAHHRDIARRRAAKILGDEKSAEVFGLALNGLLVDKPMVDESESRIRILATIFTASSNKPENSR